MAAGTLNFTRSNLQSPALDFAKELRSFGSEMVSNAKAEEALKYQREREAIQDARITDEYNRTLLDRKASDAANAELAKGRQLYGGVLNTDALTAEANKNSFTPEELTKYDMYKDSKTARAAGDSALADKMDWQNNLSNVADTLPGNNAVKESRVQMYEGIMDRLNKQGLPIPPTVIASMDQARLAEEVENANKLKENTEAQSKNAADQISNAKYLINSMPGSSGGSQPVTNENGEVVGYAPSAAINRNNKSINSYMDDVAKGSTGIIKAVTALGVKDGTPTAVDAVNLYKEILANDPTIDPGALQATIEANVGKDPTTFFGLFGGKNAALKQDNIQKLTASIKNTRVPTADVTTASSGESTKSEEAAKLSSQISTQQAGTAQQLRDERAKILRGEDGRREDRVNDILSNAGLLGNKESEKEALLKPSAEDYKGVYNTGQGYSDANSLRDKIAKNETGGVNNPYAKVHPSGALGKYGFVPSTAIEQMKALKYTGSDNELLSKFISTPSLQDTIMNNYMNTNSNTLSKNGVPVTDWTIWTSHNLGAGNAIKLAKGQIDDSVLSAIGRNLPKGMKPTVENYQAHWFDKVNDGDENKKYTAVETKADEVLKKAEETKLAEEGKTTGDSKVGDLFSKVDTTKDGINKEDILNRNSSAPLIDVKAEEDLKNVNWYNPIEKAKVRSSLVNRGYSGDDADNMINTILKEKAEKTRSDNLIADRNYRAAKRTGSKVSGKTAEEWDELRSTKNHVGDYGFLAPIAAAAIPAAITAGTLYGGATAVNGIGGTALTKYKDVVKPRPIQVKTTPLTKTETEAQSTVNTILNRGTNTKIELKNRASDLRDILSSKSKNTKAYKSAEVELQTIMKRLNDLRAY